ncbi:hypothetical protein [Azospirillum sp. B506]|uniref:hypothetical protein n=1 Tax=Azospirillum sp. B506 TaxID=137721 RepID=UPI0011DD0D87|nr:hypothetical protein [Azospirillum sp. B506]
MTSKYNSKCYGCGYYEGANSKGDIGSIFCSLGGGKHPRNGIAGCSSFSPDESAGCFRGCAWLVRPENGLSYCSKGVFSGGSTKDGYCSEYEKKDHFESHGAGRKRSSCYLTGAYVDFAGLGDDCEQLKLMRQLRDEFVIKTNDGKKMLEEYKENSPKIVEAINEMHKCEQVEVYENIFKSISLASREVKNGKFQEAMNHYVDMYNSLKSKVESRI